MPRAQDIDHALRARIRAWLWYIYKTKFPHADQKQLAEVLGVAQPTVSNILGRRGGPIGLDFVVAMHRRLHYPLDVLIDTDPPSIDSGQAIPIQAPPASAKATGQRGAGGLQ